MSRPTCRARAAGAGKREAIAANINIATAPAGHFLRIAVSTNEPGRHWKISQAVTIGVIADSNSIAVFQRPIPIIVEGPPGDGRGEGK